MIKFVALISAAVLVIFLSAVQVQAQGGDQETAASQPNVDLTLIPIEGNPKALAIPRNSCYFISYGVWRTLDSVRVDSPRINCVIYQDEECKLKVTQGTSIIKVPRKANTIRCNIIPQ
ncbi:hypothetical protein BGZ83_010091 [Gryganskiella cystojenkinii]|nr:hypothetical protein BGZ83_010091 [Gryganskiella cystojenkinii]